MNRRLPRRFEDLKGLRSRGLVRESTEKQGGHSGPVAQEREERAFAARYGLHEPDRFYTDFKTGSDARKRPEFLQMVADAKAGEFDVLMVYDTSRLSRNLEDAILYQRELHEAGVVIAYLSEGKLSSTGDLSVVVNHWSNAEWLERHKEKVAQGYRIRRFERGKYSGRPPLGYVMEYVTQFNASKRSDEPIETGKLVPDDRPQPRIGRGQLYSRADLIRHIGRLYASGRYGARTLAAHLNREGYRNVAGRPFTGSAIRVIASNPIYAGWLSWHRKPEEKKERPDREILKGTHEPLWSDALWEQIRAVCRRQHTGSPGGRARHVYPFRRLLLCDRCGARMYGEPHRGRAYMACPTQRGRRGCEQHAVRSDRLESQVEAWLSQLRVPGDWRADIERMQRALVAPERPRPIVDRAAIAGQLERLRELFVMGDIGREEYLGRKRELEASLEVGAEAPTYSEAILVQAARLLSDLGQLWAKATAEERVEIATNLFESIRVRDN